MDEHLTKGERLSRFRHYFVDVNFTDVDGALKKLFCKVSFLANIWLE
ncbi:MAG: hypothetical protein ACLSAO_07430 [Anaerovoracaceae bacterium]